MTRMAVVVVGLGVVVGCGYDGRGAVDATRADGPPGADAGDDVDAPPGTADAMPDSVPIDEVAHLSSATEQMLTSTTAWVIAVGTDIDTDDGSIDPDVPAGVVVLADVPQDNGPNVMVIQASSIMMTAQLTVHGSRPLILVGDTITTSMIDGSANGMDPGAGGFDPAMGPSAGVGAGGNGGNGSGNSDSAGAGGSFATAGGDGGDGKNITGPEAGDVYGSADSLIGGAGGGNGSPCSVTGGAGGGAIQLTAKQILTLGGGFNVGGGGGARGIDCSGDGASAGGGGAGGMIYLQSPMLLGGGNLGACGGGGGGGADIDGSSVGGMGLDAPTTGGGGAGAGAGTEGGAGGAGSSGGPGANGVDKTGNDTNGGAGGGGVGHIYVNTSGTVPGTYNFVPAVEPG